MCNACKPEDPRDEIFSAARAVRGLHALLQDRAAPCYGDSEIAVLVEFIDARLYPAAEKIQSYAPRDA